MLGINGKRALYSFTLAVGLGVFAAAAARADSSVTLTHIHGLTYSADGTQLFIPSHDGLAVLAEGRWSKAAGPMHDYMGFSATRDALYSSGHPAPGSGLTGPLGLIKSSDGGRTWQKLGLEGESDFHILATSFGTNAVYVFNGEPNSRMSKTGLYYTLNDGLAWQRAAVTGLGFWSHSLAVHPTDARVVAVGTDQGLYLSRDSGESFEQLVSGKSVLAQIFDLDGQHLWFSAHAGKAMLAWVVLKAGSPVEEVQLPQLTDDAVAYIAQNPVRRSEIAIGTYKRSVFVSKDRGRTWVQFAKDGATRE